LKHAPEIVVFDLGKVLVDFDYAIAARGFAAHTRLEAPQIKSLIDHSPLLFQFETGELTRKGFFTEVCRLTGYGGTLDEFCLCFSNIFSPIDQMVEAQSRLRRHGVPSYIFSNTNELAIEHIGGAFPFFNTFTDYILSYQHGSMKPETRLYEVVEEKSGRRGEAILYLDDRPENVASGAARGWRTILHHSPDESLSVMRELGLPV
jgi:FMN phosphatase YigB (HAD superfamily)